MSKKRFSEGFDSLFSGDDFFKEEVVEQKTESTSAKHKAGAFRKSAASKKFASGLESLLSEAFEEEVKDQLTGKKGETPSANQRKAFGGLDSLIRSTIDPKQMRKADKDARRLTILLDAEKVEQLKDIAKMEKTYLKYIIRDIVAEYLKSRGK
ncbi:MAG: hypothetical protein KDC85_21740 [Saprospiraceae bacterium]|nr:hypothetical protein [Saprospiraceae bacterium]MCB9324393.1 hypothetical protein [Lewinellaceae bacterium]